MVVRPSWILGALGGLALSAAGCARMADEGDFELARFPHVLAWHERVRAQPRHVPITHAEGSRSLGRN